MIRIQQEQELLYILYENILKENIIKMDNKPSTPTQQPISTNAQQQSSANNQGLFSNAQQQQQQASFQSLFGLNIAQPQVNQPVNPLMSFSNNANIAQQQQMVNQPTSSGFSFGNAQQQQMFNQSPMFLNQMQMPQQRMPQQQVLQQMPYPQYNANIFADYAPSVMPVQAVYNDDQKIIERVKQEQKDAKIQINLRAQRSLIKLKTPTDLPAMVSLKSTGGSRTSVDLICVIDNSGSMGGAKIQLVKETIKFLLETLTPSDRLSIITFNSYANRLCGLKCVSGENMNVFNNIVHNIQAGGGTNINSGLQLALKTIRERKQINKVTSIFLLSDGQDAGSEHSFKASLEEPINKQLGVFTLHSFGFGADHDQTLMNKLCSMKDGAFYFIKELSTLDEAFCNALGGIISLVATQIILKINNISKNLVEGIKISKVYGPMWQKINDKEYKIKLLQLMSGVTKDYVFQLGIPNIDTEVGDLDRDHSVIEAIFTAKSVSSKNMNGEAVLEMTLLNQGQNIPETIENAEVVQNYLRVKAAEAIEENMKKADQQKYDQAQKGLDTMIQCIQSNKVARKQKMDGLVNDLNNIKQKCSHQLYAQEGRKVATSTQQAHSFQNNYQYSNCVQTTMLSNLQYQKQSKP